MAAVEEAVKKATERINKHGARDCVVLSIFSESEREANNAS